MTAGPSQPACAARARPVPITKDTPLHRCRSTWAGNTRQANAGPRLRTNHRIEGGVQPPDRPGREERPAERPARERPDHGEHQQDSDGRSRTTPTAQAHGANRGRSASGWNFAGCAHGCRAREYSDDRIPERPALQVEQPLKAPVAGGRRSRPRSADGPARCLDSSAARTTRQSRRPRQTRSGDGADPPRRSARRDCRPGPRRHGRDCGLPRKFGSAGPHHQDPRRNGRNPDVRREQIAHARERIEHDHDVGVDENEHVGGQKGRAPIARDRRTGRARDLQDPARQAAQQSAQQSLARAPSATVAASASQQRPPDQRDEARSQLRQVFVKGTITETRNQLPPQRHGCMSDGDQAAGSEPSPIRAAAAPGVAKSPK